MTKRPSSSNPAWPPEMYYRLTSYRPFPFPILCVWQFLQLSLWENTHTYTHTHTHTHSQTHTFFKEGYFFKDLSKNRLFQTFTLFSLNSLHLLHFLLVCAMQQDRKKETRRKGRKLKESKIWSLPLGVTDFRPSDWILETGWWFVPVTGFCPRLSRENMLS